MQGWRDKSGHRDGWKLSYANRWHFWLLPVGGIALLLGFLSLDADPYRLPTGVWVIGLLSWVSVLLNSTLEGKYSYTKPETPVALPGSEYKYGWPEVCGLLSNQGASITHQHHFVPPDIDDENTPLHDVKFLNPLFGDLRQADGKTSWTLHPFQLELLNRFHGALQKYTTVTVGSNATGDLSLGQEFVYETHSDKRAGYRFYQMVLERQNPSLFMRVISICPHRNARSS